MKKCILAWLLMGALWGSVGCASTAHFPAWAGKNWRENGWIYFSGISDATSDIAVARQTAYSRALAAASEYVGVSVSIDSQSTLSSWGQDFSDHLRAQTADVLWIEGEVKEFQTVCKKESCTGYLLLAFKENALRKAQAAAQAKQQQKQKLLLQNARSGPWRVQAIPQWTALSPAVEKQLRRMGFRIQPNGRPVKIRMEQWHCYPVSCCALTACTATVRLELPFGERALTVRAYGNTREQAMRNIIGEWEREVETLFVEEL